MIELTPDEQRVAAILRQALADRNGEWVPLAELFPDLEDRCRAGRMVQFGAVRGKVDRERVMVWK